MNRYVKPFENRKGVSERAMEGLLQKIRFLTEKRPLRIMEVCGTHTMAIARFGLKSILPATVKLLSGPGCPVCITPNGFLDRAVAMSRRNDVIITTFGDMLRVPGSSSSLAREKQNGADVRVLYSPADALEIAVANPGKNVVFLGVGFETTTPTIADTLDCAITRNIDNFTILAGGKTLPQALTMLAQDSRVQINGLLCPGHVSTITGTAPYEPIARDYRLPCVVSGFEKSDILQSLVLLASMAAEKRAEVVIQYSRVVKPGGNPKARKLVDTYFESCDSVWRGIGIIPGSGLKLREPFRRYDAETMIPVDLEPLRENPDCSCGDILRGILEPSGCALFKRICTPENPVGPCMVSSEGSCAAVYRYEN